MELLKCVKNTFTVICKEGSTKDGEGFIQKLWEDANSHFHEVEHLAKKNENGKLVRRQENHTCFSRCADCKPLLVKMRELGQTGIFQSDM